MDVVAVIITGISRGFQNNLYPFLQEFPDNFHFFISLADNNSNDRFTNKNLQIDILKQNKQIKLLYTTNDIDVVSTRENNIILQWKRLKDIFQQISPDYKKYIRLRPDIFIEHSHEEFIGIINKCNEDKLYIPIGYDFDDFKTENIINDHVAIGNYKNMMIYCNTIDSLDNKDPKQILHYHLLNKNVLVERFTLKYHLILSDTFTIAISGDSGAGKTILSELIGEILPFDKTLIFETDRYHKWERGSENYKNITHLNPDANNLEKFAEDVYRLKLGQDIYAVDYDHSTGKFTELSQIKNNNFIIICGLHTLYRESLTELFDLKIYVDTDEELKTMWKIQRDVNERGKDKNEVINSILKRKSDYEHFIKPQKNNANIIISWRNECKLIIGLSKSLEQVNIQKYLHGVYYLKTEDDKFNYYTFTNPDIQMDCERFGHKLNLKPGYNGLIQYVILLLIWKY